MNIQTHDVYINSPQAYELLKLFIYCIYGTIHLRGYNSYIMYLKLLRLNLKLIIILKY